MLAFPCSAAAACSLWKRDILHLQKAECEHTELHVLLLQESSWDSHFPWHSYKSYFSYSIQPQTFNNSKNNRLFELSCHSHLVIVMMSASTQWSSIAPQNTLEENRCLLFVSSDIFCLAGFSFGVFLYC